MRLAAVAAAVLLRRDAQPSLEEYLGGTPWAADLDADADTALEPLVRSGIAQRHAVHGLHNVTDTGETDTSPPVQCPSGVNANVDLLRWKLKNAPRLFATTKAPAKRAYIFVIVPPGYGSTAIMSMLASSPNVGTLCASGSVNCEGCYILYQNNLMTVQKRWERDEPADWTAAISLFEPYYPAGKLLKLEKSPNNIVKTKAIAEQLSAAGHDVRFVVMSRSPCFVGPGGHHGAGIYTWAWDFFAQEMLATMQRKSAGHGTVSAMHIRYEDLLADPYKVAGELLEFLPLLESIDPTTNVLPTLGGTMLEGKDSGRSKSVVQYMLEYKTVAADHDTVPGKYRNLMVKLGYPAPQVPPVLANASAAPPAPPVSAFA